MPTDGPSSLPTTHPSTHPPCLQAAEKVKRQLARELGVPLQPPLPQPRGGKGEPAGSGASSDGSAAPVQPAGGPSMELHPYNVRRAALALWRYREQMPAAKQQELAAQIRRYLAAVAPEAPAASAGLAAAAAAEQQPEQLQQGQQGAGKDGDGGVLTSLELYSGLLAGLGRRTRRRTLKRWVQQGTQLPPELAAEAAAAAAYTGAEFADRGGAAAGAAAASAAEGEGEGEGGEEEEEQEGEEPAAPDGASTSAANGAANGSSAQPAEKFGVSDRNSGHAWHGAQVVQRLQEGGDGSDEPLLELCRRFRQCFVDALQPQARQGEACLGGGWACAVVALRRLLCPARQHGRSRSTLAQPAACAPTRPPPPAAPAGGVEHLPLWQARVWGAEHLLAGGRGLSGPPSRHAPIPAHKAHHCSCVQEGRVR